MSDYAAKIRQVVRATRIHSSTDHSWFGQHSPKLPKKLRLSLSDARARTLLLMGLQSRLYEDFYCRGSAGPTKDEAIAQRPAVGMTPFVEALSSANSGQGFWDESFRFGALERDLTIVDRADLRLWVRSEDVIAADGLEISPGARVKVRMPSEMTGMSPGYYMALGEVDFDESETTTHLRFYWNLRAEGAPEFIRLFTLELNRRSLPFRLKVLNDENAYVRCDAGVLYVKKRDREAVGEVVELVYASLADRLRPDTPALTKSLAPGLGLAEEPEEAESFGLHRCQLIAEGLVEAHERGLRTVVERLDAIADRFGRDGILLAAPYLNRGSLDDYRFARRAGAQIAIVEVAIDEAPQIPDFSCVAEELGRQLAREAIWHGSACNWVGPASKESGDVGAVHDDLHFGALGADLYGGTSGIGLFLAELNAVCADRRFEETARGALEHALTRVDTVAESDRVAFHSGWTGVAYSAHRCGQLLGDESLIARARQLLSRVTSATYVERREPDLLSGAAGSIVACLTLARAFNDPDLLAFAIRQGDDIVAAAKRDAETCAWISPSSPKERPMTGFAHGAAGIAYALLELYRSSENEKYRITAQRAFNYERQRFDSRTGNWRSAKTTDGHGRSSSGRSRASHWCHGAAGIAVSYTKAFQIMNEEQCKADALSALESTVLDIEDALKARIGNYSLCHGLCGQAEVLRFGIDVFGSSQTLRHDLVRAVATAGIVSRRENGAWPCGVPRVEAPGLMLGLAGIGHFYLRLANDRTPPLLWS